MKSLLSIVVLCFLYFCVEAKESPPKVQVYTRNPGMYGQENHFICHTSEFHPPDITIDLLEDGKVMPNAQQTDLSFETSWKFHLTKSAVFTPEKNKKYGCRVRHMSKTTEYAWEPDM